MTGFGPDIAKLGARHGRLNTGQNDQNWASSAKPVFLHGGEFREKWADRQIHLKSAGARNVPNDKWLGVRAGSQRGSAFSMLCLRGHFGELGQLKEADDDDGGVYAPAHRLA